MKDFFNGWKRKAGCVTLVLAGLFLCLWMRAEIQIRNDPDPLIESANILFVIILPLTLLSAWLLLSEP